MEFLLSFLVTWRRSTLPGPCGPSTIDTGELNFCVRDGNRCGLSVIATRSFVSWWPAHYCVRFRFRVLMYVSIHSAHSNSSSLSCLVLTILFYSFLKHPDNCSLLMLLGWINFINPYWILKGNFQIARTAKSDTNNRCCTFKTAQYP